MTRKFTSAGTALWWRIRWWQRLTSSSTSSTFFLVYYIGRVDRTKHITCTIHQWWILLAMRWLWTGGHSRMQTDQWWHTCSPITHERPSWWQQRINIIVFSIGFSLRGWYIMLAGTNNIKWQWCKVKMRQCTSNCAWKRIFSIPGKTLHPDWLCFLAINHNREQRLVLKPPLHVGLWKLAHTTHDKWQWTEKMESIYVSS